MANTPLKERNFSAGAEMHLDCGFALEEGWKMHGRTQRSATIERPKVAVTMSYEVVRVAADLTVFRRSTTKDINSTSTTFLSCRI
jgi:hypothetical protein